MIEGSNDLGKERTAAKVVKEQLRRDYETIREMIGGWSYLLRALIRAHGDVGKALFLLKMERDRHIWQHDYISSLLRYLRDGRGEAYRIRMCEKREEEYESVRENN